MPKSDLRLVGICPLELSGARLAVWFSRNHEAFVLADERQVAICTTTALGEVEVRPVSPPAQSALPLYDRLDGSDYRDLCTAGQSGFTYLTKEQYGRAFAEGGTVPCFPILTAHHFGLQGGLPVLLPTGDIVSCSGRKLALRDPEDAGAVIDSLRIRDGDVAALAAHPSQPSLLYATNRGVFVLQQITDKRFGGRRIVHRSATPPSDVCFWHDCGMLLGKRGELTYISLHSSGEVCEETAVATACRQIGTCHDHGYALVNKGMHGLALVRPEARLEELCSIKLPFSVDTACLSSRGNLLLATSKPAGEIALIEIHVDGTQ